MGQAVESATSAEANGPKTSEGDVLFIGVACCVLAVVLVFNVLNVMDEHVRGGHPIAWWKPAIWESSSGVYFIAVAPAMLAFTRRVWPLDRPRAPKLALHLLAAGIVSFAHVIFSGSIRWLAYRFLDDFYDPLAPLKDWPYELRKDLLVYAGIVTVYVAWRTLRARPAAPIRAGEDVLEVRDGARRHFVPLAEVVWVEAAGNYVELHRGSSGLLHRASLSEMERRLERAGFVRIHRSRLVRREAIAAVESKATGDFVVRLRDGRELAGSRRYRKPLLAD